MIERFAAPRALGDRGQLALAHQPVEQLGVVHDLELDAELLYSFFSVLKQWAQVETTFLTLYSLKVSTFCCGQALEDELVAGPAGRVAGAGLAVAEHAEGDAGHVEQLGDGAGGLLGAVLVGAGAADPEQPVDLVQRLDVLADDLAPRSRRPLAQSMRALRRHVPGVALVLQALEELVELGREVRLDQHLVAAHVDDVVDVLDVDRALLHAGAAGGAGPQHVGVDHGGAVLGHVEPVVAGLADQRPLDLAGQGVVALEQGRALLVGPAWRYGAFA